MLPIFLHKANFHLFLNNIDQEIAKITLKMNCSYCSGTLHQANYPRSPMGISPEFRDHYSERLSFCCDTCRKRITPSSARFFGRRWYPAPVFMLICLLSLGINERRLAQMKRHFGLTVSESTWRRWRRWWRECFVVFGCVVSTVDKRSDRSQRFRHSLRVRISASERPVMSIIAERG